jgi:hypothetical protein
MMRTWMALSLLAVALLPVLVWAGEDPVSPAEARAQMTEELMELLGKTRSTDTFMVTLTLLVESKASVRVIPEVIANAERLGIFEDHLMDDDNPKSKLAESVKDMILQIQKPGSKSAVSRACVQSLNAPPMRPGVPTIPANTLPPTQPEPQLTAPSPFSSRIGMSR